MEDGIVDWGFKCSIISLGWAGYSFLFPKRFNLYDFKKERKVRMPFDGCVTWYDDVCSLIDTDIRDVFSGIHTKLDEDGKEIVSTEYSKYNHEQTSNLDDFKEQMNKRIGQFNKELQDSIINGNTIIFFLVCQDFPHELVKILRKKYSNLRFKIFCLNVRGKRNPNINSEEQKFCKYVHVQTPSEDYIVFADYKTEEGREFEKKILSEFLMFMTELSGKKYDVEKIFSLGTRNYQENL